MKYILLSSLLLLSACSSTLPTILGITATTAAITFLQEKSIGNAVDDAVIWSRINKDLLRAGMFADVRVKVHEGRVLITGSVETENDRLTISQIVWSYTGVTEVLNDLKVNNKEHSFLKSSWITAQIKAKLLTHNRINSVNYTVETINGIVYLIGVAQDQEELDRAIALAKRVNGVQEVINYMRIKHLEVTR